MIKYTKFLPGDYVETVEGAAFFVRNVEADFRRPGSDSIRYDLDILDFGPGDVGEITEWVSSDSPKEWNSINRTSKKITRHERLFHPKFINNPICNHSCPLFEQAGGCESCLFGRGVVGGTDTVYLPDDLVWDKITKGTYHVIKSSLVNLADEEMIYTKNKLYPRGWPDLYSYFRFIRDYCKPWIVYTLFSRGTHPRKASDIGLRKRGQIYYSTPELKKVCGQCILDKKRCKYCRLSRLWQEIGLD